VSGAGDGVARNARYLLMEETVSGEVECFDLDFSVLTGGDEPDVAVQHHCLDLEFAVSRYDDGECLPAGVTTPPIVCTGRC
jgi:hypothetical protein